MKKQSFKLLLVEDDPNLQMVLQDYLELMEYEVISVSDGEAGLKAFRAHEFDICILDIMLPVMDGFELAAAIRAEKRNVPIIFLTAKTMKEDRVKGFLHGCDDYITKPFNTEELDVRIKAILRRCSARYDALVTEEASRLKLGKYIFNTSEMQLSSDSSTQPLTRKEAALLQLLSENRNKLLEREFIQTQIWGDTDYFISRSLDVFITKLRKYLKDDPSVQITNVHGTGFMLKVDEETK